jgi:hypothetical protein
MNAREILRQSFRKIETKDPDGWFASILSGSIAAIPEYIVLKASYDTIDGSFRSKRAVRLGLMAAAGLAIVYLSYKFGNYIAKQYYRFISAPVGAIQDIPFSQDYPLLNITYRYDTKYSNGVCGGLTAAWGEIKCYNTNIDILYELDRPWISSTVLLHKIMAYQDNQKSSSCSHNFPLILDNINDFEQSLGAVTKLAIDSSVNDPNNLYGLVINPQDKSGSHVFGIFSSNKNNKLLISYFDSNNREATFDNKDNAQKSLALAIRYGGYGSMFKAKPNASPVAYVKKIELR